MRYEIPGCLCWATVRGLAQACRNGSGMLRDPRQGAAGCGSFASLLSLKCPVAGYAGASLLSF